MKHWKRLLIGVVAFSVPLLAGCSHQQASNAGSPSDQPSQQDLAQQAAARQEASQQQAAMKQAPPNQPK